MTIEEIKNLDVEAIEVRMAEIKEEMNAENADLEALNAEVDAIEERKAFIKEEVEARAKEVAEVIENRSAEVIEIIDTENRNEEKTMTNIEVRNSAEYMDAFANYIKTGKDAECRALLTENVSTGVVPVPTMVEDVIRHAWEREGIMSRVKKAYLKGNLKVGFEISADGAVKHTEGASAPTEEKLVLGIVELVPASIKKWISISDEVLDMKSEAFIQYVYEEIAYQIAKKCADELVGKIEACGTVSTNTATTNVAVPAITEATISAGTIAKAIAELSDEAVDPCIIMNKSTWANFKAVQYANNYGVDVFEGLPVVFNSSVTAYSTATTGVTYCYVGDLSNGALANFPNGEEITFKFDDLSLAEKDLVKIVGREFIACEVVAPKQFVKIQK